MDEQTILDPNEMALVTTENGHGCDMFLPPFEPGEEVPSMMVALAACFLRLKNDPAFFEEMVDWFVGEKITLN